MAHAWVLPPVPPVKPKPYLTPTLRHSSAIDRVLRLLSIELSRWAVDDHIAGQQAMDIQGINLMHYEWQNGYVESAESGEPVWRLRSMDYVM